MKMINNFRKARSNNQGFTLVELIITIAVFSLVMVQISAIMFNCSKLYVKGTDHVDLQTDAQRVIQICEELMVDANDYNNANYAEISVVDSAYGIVSTNDITIKTYDLDGNQIQYDLVLHAYPTGKDYGELWLKTTNGASVTDEVLADHVSSISLNMASYQTDDKVTLSLRMKSDEYAYDSVEVKDVYLRNHIGSKSFDSDDMVPQGTYYLEVLRYAKYDLASLFGSNYTYTLSKGEYSLPSGTSTVECESTLNKNVGKQATGEVEAVSTIDPSDKFTVVLTTPKVKVGLGSEGSREGDIVIYGDGSSSNLKLSSFADVQGITLDPTYTDEAKGTFKGNIEDNQGKMIEINEAIEYDKETKALGTGNIGFEPKVTFYYDASSQANAYTFYIPGTNLNGDYYIKAMNNNDKKDVLEGTIVTKYPDGESITMKVYIVPLGNADKKFGSKFWNSL